MVHILVELYKFWSIIPNAFSQFTKTIWSTQKLSLADLHKIAAAMVQEKLLPVQIMAINTSLGDHAIFEIQDYFSGAFQQKQVADICVLLKLAFSNSSLLLFL